MPVIVHWLGDVLGWNFEGCVVIHCMIHSKWAAISTLECLSMMQSHRFWAILDLIPVQALWKRHWTHQSALMLRLTVLSRPVVVRSMWPSFSLYLISAVFPLEIESLKPIYRWNNFQRKKYYLNSRIITIVLPLTNHNLFKVIPWYAAIRNCSPW